MATIKKTEHLRFRYGMCLNDNCEKCKNKEVQQIAARKDFVCADCGKALRECPPITQDPKKKYIIILASILIIGAATVLFFGLSGGDNVDVSASNTDDTEVKVSEPQEVGSPKVEIPVETPTVVKKPEVTETKPSTVPPVNTEHKKASNTSSGTVNLGYAKFSGTMKDGKPNGQGRMTFTSSHLIDSRDAKARVADTGDYIIGEWSDGKLVQGRWYGSDNNVKGSIIIGL